MPNNRERSSSRAALVSRSNFEEHQLRAIVRFSQFLFAEGLYSGRTQQRFAEGGSPAIDVVSPTRIAFHEDSQSYLTQITGEVTEEELNKLAKFFRVEMMGGVWGRVLFYLIEGDKEFCIQGRTVRLSRLPRMFCPLKCIVPHCRNPIPQNRRTPRQPLLCDECKTQRLWHRSREILEAGFIVAYELSSRDYLRRSVLSLNPQLGITSDAPSINQAFWALWLAYVELCKYVYAPSSEYEPVACESGAFADWDSNRLKRVLQLPNELPDIEDEGRATNNSLPMVTVADYGGTLPLHYSGFPFWHVTFATDEQFAETDMPPTCLPLNAFDRSQIVRNNASANDAISTAVYFPLPAQLHSFKLVSRYKDQEQRPLDWRLNPDEENFALLENLDRILL